MIKRTLLIMASIVWSLPIQASDIEDESVNSDNISFHEQVGFAALNIPSELPNHTPESLGLLKADSSIAHFNPVPIGPALNDQQRSNPQDNKAVWFKHEEINVEQPLVPARTDYTVPRINAGFNFGRFSAQTSVISTDETFDNNSYFLQGSFALISKEQFDLRVTARFTTMDDAVVHQYYGFEHSESFGLNGETKSATNTSLGIVGTYQLSPRWKLIGSITSTNVDSQIEASPLVNSNYMHTAQFGTSYSF